LLDWHKEMNLQATPTGERVHITIFGRRNAGKSSLINALTGQPVAIVSDVPGTTTDPVSKAMELLPIGPVVLIDTAGIDDSGELGDLRVKKTLRELERTDVAVLVVEAGQAPGPFEDDLADKVRARDVPLVLVTTKADRSHDPGLVAPWAARRALSPITCSTATGVGIDAVKQALIEVAPSAMADPMLVGDLLAPGDVVVLVIPIDKAAPKGRLILPQVMVLRDVLDHDAAALVVKERELKIALERLGKKPRLVITDSQAFLKVAADTPRDVPMTGFSILMARYRGSLEDFVTGARALRALRTGQRVLIAEGCTHHRQADDIGTVQIPRWLRQMVGGEISFGHSSGLGFPEDLSSYDLIVHCGSCTLNRREVLHRQREAKAAGVPMTNYGIVLAYVHGILERALEPFPLAALAWKREEERAPVRPVRLARVTG
jgi:[FeFe] hydrogenase H-cluster maturation GTPase HydF